LSKLEESKKLPEVIEQCLKDCDNLPSLPAVAIKVLDLCRLEDTSIATLAKTVQQDPALTGRILKVINSAFYGLPNKIASISQAIGLLGIRKTKMVVLGFSVIQVRQTVTETDFDLRRYWAKAVCTAIAAKLLALHSSVHSPDEAFVAGLLQDIGVLALWQGLGQDYTRVLEKYRNSDGLLLHQIEQDMLGTDHAAVSGWLIQQWQLPDSLINAIKFHHDWDCGDPDNCPDRSLRCILELADAIARLIWRQDASQDNQWLGSCRMGLPNKTLETIITDSLQQFRQLSSAFSLEVAAPISEEQLLDAARIELARLTTEGPEDVQHHQRRQYKRQEATSELQQMLQKWEKAAMLDTLTGLADSTALAEYLDYIMPIVKQSQESLGLVIIDLDHLKQINDTCGHMVGDKAVKALADVLSKQTRQEDLVARLSDNEFLVILRNAGLMQVVVVVERIHEQIKQTPVGEGSQQFDLEASIGMASSDQFQGEFTYEDLLAAAEMSLYDAKESGRNRIGRLISDKKRPPKEQQEEQHAAIIT